VSYRVVNGTLVRRESQPTRDLVQLDALWQAAVSDSDTSGTVALEEKVASMQIETWVNNAWRQAGVDPSANAGATSNRAAQANPIANQLQANGVVQTGDPTGMQVAIQVQGQQVPMLKSFLLVP
jgi:general secretion pathway protein J